MVLNNNAMTVIIPKFKIGERVTANPMYGGGTMTVIGYEDSDSLQLYYYCVRECTVDVMNNYGKRKRLLNYKGTDRELHAEEDLARTSSDALVQGRENDNMVLKWKSQ
jgi:hypothetical protein